MTISFEFAPIPKFFKDNGYYKDHSVRQFVAWAFERCSHKAHTVIINQKEIQLEAFEFVFGRESCVEETGIPEKKLRLILDKFKGQQIIEKRASKSTNKFTVYRWITERFSKKEEIKRASRKLNLGPQIREYINNNINIVISPTALPIANSFVMNLPTNSKIVPINVMFQKPQNVTESKLNVNASMETIKSPQKAKTQETKPKACKKNYFDRKTQKFSDIDKRLMDYWREKFPRIHLEYQFEKMTEWLKEHPTRKGTQAFITNWLKKAETWRHNQELNRDPERFKLLNEIKNEISIEEIIANMSPQEREQHDNYFNTKAHYGR